MRLLLIYVFLLNGFIFSQSNKFIKGVDLSSVKHIEDLGGTYYTDGVVTDPLVIFRQSGANWFRLRLWHTPADGYSNLDNVIAYAIKGKQAGLKFLLDIHYSDTWADPGKQFKPVAWRDLEFNILADSVYTYTYRVLKALNDLGVPPEMVQIGNEITSGMLWPDGRVGGSYESDSQWQKFTTLLNRGISAVHAAVSDSVKIMIHIDRGGNNNSCRWYYGKLKDYNVNYDVIGLSFYPWWHGTLTTMRSNINDLATRFDKDIVIAETAYPWTLDWFDNVGNLVGGSNQLHSGYPASVDGQQEFLSDLLEIVKNAPNGKGAGAFYWEPAYIAVAPYGSPWENLAMFDFYGNALTSLKAFEDVIVDTSDAINVTFRLNTSTNSDTLNPSGIIQMRGETVKGNLVLHGDEEITWDVNSDIFLINNEGDYWETTVRMIPNTEFHYKYWAGHTISKPTHLRLGWEGAVQPYDGESANYRKFIAGAKDTTLKLEFFNSSAETRDQYWSPFNSYEDSIGVLFRVNMTGAMSSGRFNSSTNGPLGIRGESSTSSDRLSWDKSNILFHQELNSVNDNSFWSVVVYFPKSSSGNLQKYKFFIENDSENGWENNISDRTFIIPQNDSTLHWNYFDKKDNTTGLKVYSPAPDEFEILENYPNPFNPSTKIKFSLSNSGKVKLSILNILGSEIRTLINDVRPTGVYELIWDGKNASGNMLGSGIYIIQLRTNSTIKVKKAMLVK